MSNKPSKILGLTGNIASGKSTVAAMLAQHGAVVIDSDTLVRELYADPQFVQLIAAQLGADIVDAQGHIDRIVLRAKVFSDETVMAKLEALVHPAVQKCRASKMVALSETAPPVAFVNEAVKLVESGHARHCSEVWCVESTSQVQLRRLMEHRGLSEEEALARLAAQPSRERKRELLASYAPCVPLVFLPNSGTREELARIVEQHWRRFIFNSEISDAMPGAG